MRKLATIQIIKDLQPIENADRIEVATVLGWHLVVKKGEFKVGDFCVYFEVDSFLPVRSEFEFLAGGGTKKMVVNGKEEVGYRLKTVRLRGQISQGLALPLTILPESYVDELSNNGIEFEGLDVSSVLDIHKYEPPIPANLSGEAKGLFPSFIPKTDEERLQGVPQLLERYQDTKFYATEKIDGSSMTVYFKDGELNVCSRNLNLKENEGNTLWRVARELGLERVLKDTTLALQGEIYGEGIQNNKLKIKGQRFALFNIYDFKNGQYLNHKEMIEFAKANNIETVPEVATDCSLLKTVDEMVAWATRTSLHNPNVQAEGLVFRPMVETQDPDLGRLSFKVINPEFLLKHGE